MNWAFDPFMPLSYDVILADPATRFETWSTEGEGKSPQAHYDTMTWEQLGMLPVADLARGDALLFLWACWPTIRQSLSLMETWGFNYVTGGSWHKRTKHGKSNFGCGYRLRSATEPFLIGTLGNPATSKSVRNLIDAVPLEIDAENLGHSRKPDDQYELCEKLCVRATRFIELFSRKSRPGWDHWGNEAGKFDQAVAA